MMCEMTKLPLVPFSHVQSRGGADVCGDSFPGGNNGLRGRQRCSGGDHDALSTSAKATSDHLAASGCGDVHGHSLFFFAPPSLLPLRHRRGPSLVPGRQRCGGARGAPHRMPLLANGPTLWYQLDDDVAGLRELLAACPSLADEPAPWYSLARGTEPLTPLMVATAYGSVACLDVLLSPPYLVDPNRASASSLSTPLHLAAAGGATSTPTSVSRLLAAGTDNDNDEVEERQGEEGRARNLQKLSDNSGEFERGSVDLQMIRFEELLVFFFSFGFMGYFSLLLLKPYQILGNKPKFSTLKGGDGMRDPSLMHMGGPHCTSSISDDHEELSSISGVFSMPSSRPYNVPPLHAGASQIHLIKEKQQEQQIRRAQTPIRKTLACAETSRETPSFCLIASQGRHPTLSVHSPLRVSDDELTSDNDRPLLQATAA
uniref:Uncharacterized protein n=2 Tax=Oryza sativa subsp. japonica TaxID=39947 RepID=A0A5S6RAF4_ORYSJ|nr:hypothetical protein [Oryza sativa Japonica Group]AAP54184.1 hypothetical protein LOC_Os10g32800 [Oryza sativa Japonica Group]